LTPGDRLTAAFSIVAAIASGYAPAADTSVLKPDGSASADGWLSHPVIKRDFGR